MPGKKIISADVVAYIGGADIREIDKAAWDNVDVTDQDKVVWDKGNNWQVPVADLSDAAVAYCAGPNSGFVVKTVRVDR